MCDTPENYKQAFDNYAAIEKAYRKAERAMKREKAKLKAAQDILAEEVELNTWDKGCPVEAPVSGGTVIFGAAARVRVPISDQVAPRLEAVQKGLSVDLAKYSVTDISRYLAPIVMDEVCEESFRSRVVKFKPS